jgi:acetylornithine deacetylase ArgE
MDDVESIAAKLISLDSRSQIGNALIADFISDFLEPVAERLERIEYTDPAGQRKISLVAQIGKGEGGLALCGHMDTVPALEWPTDPFQARTVDGRLYGLGAVDMKGALACTLAAARSYPELNATKPLALLYTTDEEVDSEGARRIAEGSRILASVRPDFAVISEPTELCVVNGHKADSTFTATAAGRAAHSSSGKGLNANLKMIPFINDMRHIYNELMADEAYWDTDFDPPYPDWNIVIDNFGTPPNITVPTCQCQVKFRYTRNQDPTALVRRVEESARTHGVDLEYRAIGEPLYTPPDSPPVKLSLELAAQERALVVPYRTDASFLGSVLPCIVLGPGSLEQAHTPDEWIGVDQLHRGAELFQRLVQRVCRLGGQ